MTEQLTTRPVPVPSRPAFDRYRWERALFSAELPHRNARLLGLVLAHYAGPAGYLPAGGMQHAGRLAEIADMTGRQVRMSLYQLERAGLIARPDIATWEPRELVRPITLTLPPAGGAARTEPPHSGERPS
ncbi:hypothetical protein ACFOOM_07720 [Streptomyces echinoruber]|uniref:Helix-turn-helix domain-containing protein n=1 Tax=Streptomyces echinoruber TaxID=68898 RepID=A0A918V8U0_9ACTN|nr:hypothetical protein [Streptomyces echinoruber]GGZ80429.1 hypothetical protein GCM10010389_17830 [Streptomyces echinoruber]